MSQAAFKFQPFSRKQKKLLTWWMPGISPYADYDMVIADGSIRSGKTIACIDGFLMQTLHQFSGENFILAGKSMGALKRNVIDPMQKILTAKGILYDYKRSENPHIRVGTNVYYLFGANNEASQDTLQGLTAAGAYADEVALFPRSFVEQMIGRCSVEGSKLWLNCNPEGPYHYIKTDYIDKAAEKRILRLHFTLDDNLTLSPRVKERYKRMYSGVFYKRNIDGLWVVAEGLIYDQFNHDTMVVDKLPPITRYWVGVDYGTSNATVFLLVGLGTDGRLYVIDEFYHSGTESGQSKSPTQYSKEFRKFIKGKNYDRIFPDPSAEGFILQLYQDGVKRITPADNNVKNGIELVSSMIANDMLRVHKRCKHTLQEFSSYAWDPKAQERGEDKPLKQNDHCMDALRYIAYSNRLFWQRMLERKVA